MLLPAYSTAPSGKSAGRLEKTLPSKSSWTVARCSAIARRVVLFASIQLAAQSLDAGGGSAPVSASHSSRGSTCSTSLARPGRVPPATGVDEYLARAGIALQVLQQRFGRRHRAEPYDHRGLQPIDGGRIAQECVIGIDHERSVVIAAAHAAERIGQDRIPQALCQARHGRGQPRIVLGATHDDPAAGRRQIAGQAVDQLVGRAESTGLHVDVTSAWRGLELREHQRLTKRPVQVDWASRLGDRCADGARGDRAHQARLVCRLRLGQIEEPFDVFAVQPQLVDRLGRTAVAQLVGAIGGQDDQRHAGEKRLDDGWEEVGRRRSRCGEQADWLAQRTREPEPEIRRRALVEVHPDLDVGVLGQAHGQRCGARARAHKDVPYARTGELSHEGADHHRGGHSSTPSAASMGWSFQPDSAYSVAGLESATMPQPANNVAELPSSSAERMPTTNSPSPARFSQPIGPAYQPRSSPSRSRISSSARCLETAHRGRRMQALDKVQDADARGDLAANGREQVLHVRQLLDLRLGIGR